MGNINHRLMNNPLMTYEDLEKSLIELVSPVYQVMESQQTPGRFHLYTSGTVYSIEKQDIEGFLRTLWGLGPLFRHPEKIRKHEKIFCAANRGILIGTNPKSPYYWGELEDYDQLFVEMGALSVYLLFTKKDFWDTLSESQQQDIYHWLNQINHHTIPQTNWLFFRVLVNNFFLLAQLEDVRPQIEADLAKIDTFYLEEGWYFDGYEKQIDYYIPFAMQYYALLLTAIGVTDLTPHLEKYRLRAQQFSRKFKNWFVQSGAALPFGRSTTYRFAQSAFFAAAALAKQRLDTLSSEEAKYLLFNNMRYWFKQPIFNQDDTLSIGYQYPNKVMAEGYNGPGSPYWALKNYIVLALDEKDDFWTIPEKQPSFSAKELNPYSKMLIVHSPSGKELQAFTVGQHSHEHAHGQAKYEKFVYSTTFGYSVPKGSVLPKQGAFDNTLAISEKDIYYQTVFDYEQSIVTEEYLYGLWKPFDDVAIHTFIIPDYPWHYRIHYIETKRALNAILGGFSTIADGKISQQTAHQLLYQSSKGTIGLHTFDEQISLFSEKVEPNTNVLYPQSMLVYGKTKLTPGKHILSYAVLGNAFDEINEEAPIKPILYQNNILLGNKTLADLPIHFS